MSKQCEWCKDSDDMWGTVTATYGPAPGQPGFVLSDSVEKQTEFDFCPFCGSKINRKGSIRDLYLTVQEMENTKNDC